MPSTKNKFDNNTQLTVQKRMKLKVQASINEKVNSKFLNLYKVYINSG